MKHLLCIAVFLSGSFLFAQNEAELTSGSDLKHQMNNLGITITVDSEKEIEDSINYEDIKSLAYLVEGDQELLFKLICKNKAVTKNIDTYVFYKVEGNTKDLDGFMALIDKVKESAKKYYKKS